MKIEPRKYFYDTEVEWTTERKGIMRTKGMPDIDVACAPEFGGHKDIWTPEHLFVGSIEICTMSTFLFLAHKEGLEIASYKSTAKGEAQMVDGAIRYVSLVVKPVVEIFKEADRATVKKIFAEIGTWCMISNSIIPEVKIETEIIINND